MCPVHRLKPQIGRRVLQGHSLNLGRGRSGVRRIPFGLALASQGFAAFFEDPHLRAGLNVHRGRLTYKAVAESLGLSFSPLEDGIAA